MRYAIVIEKGASNYAAYVPDLPGCVTTGETIQETKTMIREAIEFHLEGLRADSLPIPPPSQPILHSSTDQLSVVSHVIVSSR